MSADHLSVRLGRNLRIIRTHQGLSQEALAQQCDLHRTYIGAIERGERNVTLQTLEKLASALDVDPIDLLQEPEHWSPRTRQTLDTSSSSSGNPDSPSTTL